jgi:uncharacterized membrane protein
MATHRLDRLLPLLENTFLLQALFLQILILLFLEFRDAGLCLENLVVVLNLRLLKCCLLNGQAFAGRNLRLVVTCTDLVDSCVKLLHFHPLFVLPALGSLVTCC